MELNHVYQGDCIQLAKEIPSNSVDLVFCDLPYGETNNHWDSIIPFEDLWNTINRVKKENSAVCLFAKGKFVGQLMCSNLDSFKYEIIVEKTQAKGHLNAKKMPMKAHENILVFYDKLPTYNPQISHGHTPVHNYTKYNDNSPNYGAVQENGFSGGGSTDRYPRDVIKYAWPTYPIHPTEKPVDLCEYIIKTYSNPGDVILDLTTGSGSIPLAAIKNNRKFYAFDSGYCIKDIFNGLSWSYIANHRISNYLENNEVKSNSEIVKNLFDKHNSLFKISNYHSLSVNWSDNSITLNLFDEYHKTYLFDGSKKSFKEVISQIMKENMKTIKFNYMEE